MIDFDNEIFSVYAYGPKTEGSWFFGMTFFHSPRRWVGFGLERDFNLLANDRKGAWGPYKLYFETGTKPYQHTKYRIRYFRLPFQKARDEV